jgi:Uma2 family endonuclease
MVLVVNPRRRGAAVYRPGRSVLVLSEQDEISGSDIVPGWSIRIQDVFH